MDLNLGIYISVAAVVGVALVAGIFKLGSWHGTVNTSIDGIRDDLGYIRRRLDEIFSRLVGENSRIEKPADVERTGQKIE